MVSEIVLETKLEKVEKSNLKKTSMKSVSDTDYPMDNGAIFEIESSKDGTTKFIFNTGFHCVLIPGKSNSGKNTLCVSSQVGCAMGCTFCLTAKMGFMRNLSADEIVLQFETALNYLCEKEGISISDLSNGKNSKGVKYASDLITSMVYMGMGEPFNNYDNVVNSISCIHEKYCYSFSKITVSTSGVVPAMKKFIELDWKVHLAISFHSPFQDVRDRLMPFLSRWKIPELVSVCNEYSSKFRDKIMVEYIMIKGVTDRPEDLEALLALGFVSMTNFNLIPLNGTMELEGKIYYCSDDETLNNFHSSLRAAGFKCFTRKNMGEDIEAACGMLNQND
jgi:23S rRNA (adenine2503-C2)-methyltransferase